MNDLRGLEISWERAEELATDRVEWRSCVARCADMHRIRDGKFNEILSRETSLKYFELNFLRNFNKFHTI